MESLKKTAERHYATAIRTTRDGFLIADMLGKFLDVNEAYCQMIGYSRQELLKMSVKDVDVSEDIGDVARRINKVVETGSDSFEARHRRKDGIIIDVAVNVNNLHEDGERFFAFLRDISPHKRLEEKLLKANNDLLELDRQKNEFINMTSHELRTPLAITKEGISQLAEGMCGEVSPGQRRFLDISLRNLNRLVRVVDNIFDISEVEFQKPSPKKEPMDIVELARGVIADFIPLAKAKGLEIKDDFAGEKIMLFAEKRRIRQALANLVSNAVKFSEKGYVEVRILDKGDTLECSVADTGIGIAEDNLPKVFDKFQQFSRAYGPGEKGTGLGLALVKGIVELHKGRIWAESHPAKGSRFSFTLPKGDKQ